MLHKHIVNLSDGICSWFTARRVIEIYGTAPVTLLFADTCMEDDDLYRFLGDCENDLGVPVTRIADGRTPWDVFSDVRFLGNTRIDPCSRILKRELLNKWHTDNCDPQHTTIHIGLGHWERDRFTQFKAIMAAKGWHTEAPACDPPYVDKDGMLQALRDRGIEPPDLYLEGFPHNNCGGFCIKAGQAQFRLLLAKRPDTYAFHEKKEQELRKKLGKDVAILRDRRGGELKPLTLKVFRERYERGEIKACNDWGGCGCAISDTGE